MTGQGPLHGVRVIELATNTVGPLAAQLLGDMGADVIKVEAPEGDHNRINGPARNPKMAAMFLGMNRSKRSLVLDIKKPEGREAMLRLISTADVFINNMRREAIERVGLLYAQIAADNPRLIYAFNPGWRLNGPYSNRAAYDDVIQGFSGMAGIMARANGTVRYMPSVVIDKLCGYILSSSVAMALYARTRTGKGQQVEVPMLENVVAFLMVENMWDATFDPPVGKIGYPRMFTSHRRPLKTRDNFICLLVITDDQWRRLFSVLEVPELASDPRFVSLDQRSAHIDELYEIVAAKIATRTTQDWQQRLDAADLPNAPMNRLEDLMNDPYLKQTAYFEHYQHPTEGMLVRTPITTRFSRTPASIPRPPPRHGEHSHEILKELGYGDAQIAQMSAVRDAAPKRAGDRQPQ